MKKLLLIFVSVFTLCISASTQTNINPNCPSISVLGPTELVEPNHTARYTAKIDTKGQKLYLKYSWSVSAGTITGGQGTTSIEVKAPKPNSLTVTFDVAGVPNECPRTVSETAIWDPTPEAVKLAQFDGSQFKGDKLELNKVVREMNDNPNNQLYVYFAYKKELAEEAATKREQDVADYLATVIGDRSRMTIVRVFGGIDLVQFWRIPPGADNPVCNDCEQTACPTISVSSPAGIVEPGETLSFKAQISGQRLNELKYEWSVKSGKIVKGQNTSIVDVIYSDYPHVEATVTVAGLPSGCPNSASELYEIAVDPGPIKLGEVTGPKYLIGRELLTKIENEGKINPHGQLYVAVQFVQLTSPRTMRRVRMQISSQLKKTKIDKSRMTLVLTDNGNKTAIFWMIPPGVENPYIDK